MHQGVYFNDNEPYVAEWLGNLFPAATVDCRGIADLQGADLDYNRVHLFAGIGGWEYALSLAGWPDDAPVWTGSCPCQPFSSAGKHKGEADSRHLWPEFRRLIAECHPPVIFGEQVASPDGRKWLAGVRTDLEALGYAVGAADLCAAGIGAPHIRQRLYWVACTKYPQWRAELQENGNSSWRDGFGWSGTTGRLANAEHPRHDRPARTETEQDSNGQDGRLYRGSASRLADTSSSPLNQLLCADGKVRRFEPSSFPLAYGVPGRVGQLRAYGNAIVPQVAATFIRAFMESVSPVLGN